MAETNSQPGACFNLALLEAQNGKDPVMYRKLMYNAINEYPEAAVCLATNLFEAKLFVECLYFLKVALDLNALIPDNLINGNMLPINLSI